MSNRDANGRFLKGHAPTNKGKGGRPKRSTEDRYLKTLTRRVSIKAWEAIVDKAIMRAQSGDAVARKWLSDYLLGPPKQKLELEGTLAIQSSGSLTIYEYPNESESDGG